MIHCHMVISKNNSVIRVSCIFGFQEHKHVGVDYYVEEHEHRFEISIICQHNEGLGKTIEVKDEDVDYESVEAEDI